ncbi:membrane-associated protein, putative [Bodo saltans]|uniref:Membrane-associated protein, putative n=1 Tax=Bodo saltans TaxID=75058 RepID=A0A0S4IVA8_BODSA|nr:membrane-associated protein, putative [Bodo saltans]|eukprot:CUG17037.1 membrane-associated protein, putative [Bodo saltans]
MTTGVFFVIAFGACVVGMLGTSADEWLISTNALYQTNAQVLAGYADWNTILDNKTGQVHLSRFFMTTGVFFVIAFGACVVGMLGTSAEEWLISTNALYQTNAQVLAGYADWNTMTSNCCCIESTNPPDAWAVSERWICNNGKVIERGRQSVDGSTSLPLRAVCGVAPTNSSCVISTTSGGVPYMNCPSDVKAYYVPSQVTENAYDYYF